MSEGVDSREPASTALVCTISFFATIMCLNSCDQRIALQKIADRMPTYSVPAARGELARIADALERAYPKPVAAEVRK